jgi:D-3-phosphoglycerate dehydrogenase
MIRIAKPMRVVVTDRPFPDPNPYENLIENTTSLYDDVTDETGAELIYADCSIEEETIEACLDADIIITFIAPITADVLDAAGDVRLVIRQGAGYDNVDVKAATTREIPVSNAPDYGSRDVASHGIALALAASHNIVQADQQLRKNDGWGSSRVIHPIQGGTYGIVGLGRIGRRAVPMARGLGMDVIAHDPVLDDDVFEMLDVEPVSFNTLLSEADCITLHASLRTDTHHLFSSAEFSRMKDSAILVNVARGPLVDEDALVTALDEGEIHAAGLDVFESEPPTDSSLLDCEKVVCSPHHAGGSPGAKERKIEIVRNELRRALRGETLHNVVNREVFQHKGWKDR